MLRQWKRALELHLRRVYGTGFQDFVGSFMTTLLPGDFQRIKAQGSLGDGGNDGFRMSDGTLFQCYGANGGQVQDVRSVCRKLGDDFEKARLSTPQMKKWRFTHNLIDMPQPLFQAYLDLEPLIKSHGIEPGLFGPDKFQSLLPRFTEEDLEDLIGVAIHSKLDVERLPEVVRLIVTRVMQGLDSPATKPRDITIPPQEKLEFNEIPERWRKNIVINLPYADIVNDILDADEAAAEGIPYFAKRRYLELAAQDLDAGEILKLLYEDLAGYVNNHDGRYEASITLIAALFEACVIFKDKKKTDIPEFTL